MSSRKIKTPKDSETFIAEIVGEESLIGQRMSAGRLMYMMDIAAAVAAQKHCESNVVTLAFDRLELLDQICHKDYVSFNAYVIEVGQSSMVVKVDGFHKAPGELDLVPGNSGIVTMVAIDRNGKPNKHIPGLHYRTPEEVEMRKLAESRQRIHNNRRKRVDQIQGMREILVELLKDSFPRTGCYPSAATELIVRKIFLPRNSNMMGNVFGGDTVEMMEDLAVATARQFTGNYRMVTIAMEDVLFFKPLQLKNLVEMRANVVFVANTTLMVKITVKAIPRIDSEEPHITNHGLFTVLNYDRSGRKKSITNGLDMKHSNLEMRREYLKELVKYEKRTGCNTVSAPPIICKRGKS